ncbi:STAS domain-containing protein [Verminephrobacter sp. Larva24]|nr:STAS domain-containing protein [Verminephrobacter sp. Larva24]
MLCSPRATRSVIAASSGARTALAVLLECRRAALSEGRGFAVQDLPLALAGMARLYGVDGLLTGG